MLLQEKLVKRAIRSVDPRLYLERRWTRYSGDYYVIAQELGELDPLVAVDWRHRAEARPLSLDIVDQLRRQEGDLAEITKKAISYNRARKEQLRAEARARQDEAIEDWQKSKPGKLGVRFD